jgi:hypothetical protein
MIDRLKAAPAVVITKKPYVVFLSADPGGGGPSDLAMTAMVQVGGRWVVILSILLFYFGTGEECRVSTFSAAAAPPEYTSTPAIIVRM